MLSRGGVEASDLGVVTQYLAVWRRVAVVVTTALRRNAMILTGDPDDIERLVRPSGREVVVAAV